MTVAENIAFAMRAVGAGRKKIKRSIPLLLKIVDLETKADRFPHELSGGEQQRVALARALANNPKYIIADEPTGNVDKKRSEEIMELLLKVSRLGKTVIVVTHEQALVEHLDQRVVTISRGHIVSDRRNAAEEQGA
jgi:cell division transport system ATP-binding protein